MNEIKLKHDEWQQLQQKLAKVEEVFLNLIDGLDVNLRGKKLAESSWSATEILSHIVGWEVEVVKKFKIFLTNPDVDDTYDIDSFNKSEVESRKHLSWDKIVAELKTAQTELSEFLSTLKQKEIDEEKRFVEWVKVLADHYIHHSKQLNKIRNSNIKTE